LTSIISPMPRMSIGAGTGVPGGTPVSTRAASVPGNARATGSSADAGATLNP
jgi:hypothetical protein